MVPVVPRLGIHPAEHHVLVLPEFVLKRETRERDREIYPPCIPHRVPPLPFSLPALTADLVSLTLAAQLEISAFGSRRGRRGRATPADVRMRQVVENVRLAIIFDLLLAPGVGLEPTTLRLTAGCSAD